MPLPQLPADHHERDVNRVQDILFRSYRGLQAAELNELQAILRRRGDSVAGVLFQPGQVISGAEPFMLPPEDAPMTFDVKDGKLFLKGEIHSIAGEQLAIPLDEKVAVGIRYREIFITENDDAGLRDPAVGTPNYQEPGAARAKAEMRWGWAVDDVTRDDYTGWQFFPVYEVDHGAIVIKAKPALADPWLDQIARYDREAHGNYVVRGLVMRFTEETDDNYIYDLSDGVANILGYKVARNTSTRLVFEKDADTRTANNEPHTFVADGNGEFALWVNRPPLASIGELLGVKSKTEAVTHGIAGSLDQLTEAAVVSVVSVVQGATTYAFGTDYTVSGDKINWTPAGAEPAPGSTYNVTYHYQTTITPDETHRDYIVVSGLVPNSLIQIDYNYKLPRMDLVVMNREGVITKIKGVSQLRNPVPPQPAPDQIALATIYYNWLDIPAVRNVSIRAVPFWEIEDMRSNIYDLYDLVAMERLKTDAIIRDPATKRGVFVDNFLDNDLRDEGRPNTALVDGGFLTLPINNESSLGGSNNTTSQGIHTLNFILEAVIEQPDKTACMKINPYAAFDPIPGSMILVPGVDQWTELTTVWAKPVIRNLGTFGNWHPGMTTGPTQVINATKTVTLKREAVASEFCRVRPVQVELSGFGPGETITSFKFDGVEVALTDGPAPAWP